LQFPVPAHRHQALFGLVAVSFVPQLIWRVDYFGQYRQIATGCFHAVQAQTGEQLITR
jgi:hypothetical protein